MSLEVQAHSVSRVRHGWSPERDCSGRCKPTRLVQSLRRGWGPGSAAAAGPDPLLPHPLQLLSLTQLGSSEVHECRAHGNQGAPLGRFMASVSSKCTASPLLSCSQVVSDIHPNPHKGALALQSAWCRRGSQSGPDPRPMWRVLRASGAGLHSSAAPLQTVLPAP